MAKSQSKILILVVLIIVLVLLNVIPGVSKALGNFVFKIFSPISRFFAGIGDRVVGFFEVIFSIKDLAKENAFLEKENQELEAEISLLKEVEQENLVLRKGLEISEKEILIKEIAFIVSKDIQGIKDWVLINKGSKHGIQENMAVISSDMALVGRIVEVMPSFSKVMLISNKESIVAALVENARSEGLVKKRDKLFMDFIPRSESLKTGERIITSGMDKIYPKGILIGEIEDIDLSNNQLFQKITIAPAVDFSKLETVFIIK